MSRARACTCRRLNCFFGLFFAKATPATVSRPTSFVPQSRLSGERKTTMPFSRNGVPSVQATDRRYVRSRSPGTRWTPSRLPENPTYRFGRGESGIADFPTSTPVSFPFRERSPSTLQDCVVRTGHLSGSGNVLQKAAKGNRSAGRIRGRATTGTGGSPALPVLYRGVAR